MRGHEPGEGYGHLIIVAVCPCIRCNSGTYPPSALALDPKTGTWYGRAVPLGPNIQRWSRLFSVEEAKNFINGWKLALEAERNATYR